MVDINVTRSGLPPMEEYIEKLRSIWESAWLTNMGQFHIELEAKLKEYLGQQEIVLFSNGHMALELLIEAMELKGEIITTPYSFISTTHAIVRNGIKPVFCDIREEDFTIDPEKIEKLITAETSAIVAVHVYGYPCQFDMLHTIAKKHNLKLIYDAAHCFGEFYKSRSFAEYGDASMYSFHATKVFHTIEGGAIACKDEALGKKLNLMKNFGIAGKEEIPKIGANAKMNEFQAAMGLCNLEHLKQNISLRRQVALRYREKLFGIEAISMRAEDKDCEYNYAYMPVLINENSKLNRDEVYDRLIEYGIYTRKYFYPCINDCECYEGKYEQTPIAHRISKQILTLPIYPELKIEEVDYICERLISLVN